MIDDIRSRTAATKRNKDPIEPKPHKTFITDAVSFCPALGELRSKDHILKNIKELYITGSGFKLTSGYPEGVDVMIEQSPQFLTRILVTITAERVTLSPMFFMR